jgi:subtilase family serine protease
MNIQKLIFAAIFLLSLSITVMAQEKADLRVTEIENPEWRDGSYINVDVKNIGKAESAPVKLKVWDLDISAKEAKKFGVKKRDLWIFQENSSYSEDGSSDYDENWEETFEIKALKPGESISVIIFVGHWVFDPNCEIGAEVDFENSTTESNEKNNKLYYYLGG